MLGVVAFIALMVIASSHASAIAAEGLGADLQCLALNIYHEARGEPEPGKIAVAQVVINRARHPDFPRRICDVVYQHAGSSPAACEFSWTCDGVADQPNDIPVWRQSMRVARLVYFGMVEDPTAGAMWYHADYVAPGWARRLATPLQIGRHLFYRDDNLRLAAETDTGGRLPLTTDLVATGGGSVGSLPGDTTTFLQSLKVTMIRYTALASDRAARINNVMYRQGDPLTHGLTLASIARDAIILRYQDRLFRFVP